MRLLIVENALGDESFFGVVGFYWAELSAFPWGAIGGYKTAFLP
jgi:hypothetical protein